MTVWEKKIIDAFTGRGNGEQNNMRLRSDSIFPDFDAASPDEREAYLEAAESLERKGLLVLKREKWNEGERLKTLACENIEKLFGETGKKSPVIEAERIRLMIKKKLPQMEAAVSAKNKFSEPKKVLSFLRYLAEDFSAADIRYHRDPAAPDDFVRLMEILLEPAKLKNISTRALSIQLYNDSKRLEYLLGFAAPFLSQARKEGVPIPDLSFLERSFPETTISGKLIFEFAHNELKSEKPMVNSTGIVMGLPFSSVLEIRNIKTITRKDKPKVLTIENKETFYALASSGIGSTGDAAQTAPAKASVSKTSRVKKTPVPPRDHDYDCYLYTSGYPNRAVAAIIKLLAASGFSFYHAGDLDPDGILILQSIRDIAEKPVTPLRMDAATFDRYLPWARSIDKNLQQLTQVSEGLRAVPELAGLISRIEETRLGVEQEIIDYR
jgi:hypothetical protein